MSEGFISPDRSTAVVPTKGRPPLTRPLQIYAFDPSLGRRHGNHTRVSIPYESLRGGLRGQRVEVIDYDATNDEYYEAVDLDDPHVLLQGGLPPSEADPRFHQQMVYAVVMKTMETFKTALGRPMEWSRRGGKARPLRVFPHAMQEANAYYDPERHALLFGYFTAQEADGALTGQTVFSCLSHDIVAHETAHALVHDVRRFFNQPTGPDTLAFHEAFADIVALFQHFTFRDALVGHILGTGGALFRPTLAPLVGRDASAPSTLDSPTAGRPSTIAEEGQRNVLVGLAQQFGEAMGLRASLRSALSAPPDPSELQRRYEAHERGAILVAAVFDAFFTVYSMRVADLMRIARVGTHGELSVDLANRLATEATKTARQFGSMCVRALDYCPPVDITFGDYLRALVTADLDLVPDDDLGYRDILLESFRRRGIRPEDVTSFSESSLRWQPPDGQELYCKGLDFRMIGQPTPESQQRNARKLHEFATQNLGALYLAPPDSSGRPKVAVWSFHPVSRIGPDGQLRYQIVAELIQQKTVPTGRRMPGAWKYRGGTTLVIDARTGRVEYAIYKRLESPHREARQAAFHEDRRAASRNAYASADVDVPNFAAVHRGY